MIALGVGIIAFCLCQELWLRTVRRGAARLWELAAEPQRPGSWRGAMGPVAAAVVRHTPTHRLAALERELGAAGRPWALNAGEYRALQWLLAVGVGLLSGGMTLLLGDGNLTLALAAALLAYLAPRLWLDARAARRRGQLLAQLPGALDLLVVGAEAGLNISRVLAVAARRTGGALGAELALAVREMQVGRSLAQALRSLAQRAALPELDVVVQFLLRSDTGGTPVAQALRDLAQQMRTTRRHRLEVEIGKLPIKLTLVTIGLFMPALFALAVLPNLVLFASRW